MSASRDGLRSLSGTLTFLVFALLLGGGAMARQASDKERLIADFKQAEKLRANGKDAEAAKLYESITERAEQLFGSEHPNTAELLNNRGMVLVSLRQLAEARTFHARSVKIAEKHFPDDARLPRYLHALGEAYRRDSLFEKAEPLFTRALKLREKLKGQEVAVAETLNSLAILHQDNGDLSTAEPLYHRCLKIREKELGPNAPDLADTLTLLGQLYDRLGQDTKALKYFERGLSIREAKLGAKHVATGATLNDMGAFYLARQRWADAEPLLRRALKVFEEWYGPEHPSTGHMCNNLGWACLQLKKTDEAEKLLTRASKIWAKKLRPDDPLLARGWTHRAHLAFARGEQAEARALLKKAVQVREASLVPDHPYHAESLADLAALEAAGRDWDTAADLLDKARRSVRRYMTRELASLSEGQQLAFLQRRYFPDFHAALTVAWKGHTNEKLVEASAGWVRNGKGVAGEVLTSRALLARDEKDPDLAKVAAQLLTVRQQLARLAFAATRVGEEKERKKRYETLAQQEQDLGKRLWEQGGRVRTSAWVGLPSIRKALPEDAALIDIARFDVYDFNAKPGEKRLLPARYAAWVTTNKGPVRLIDLGPADPIDKAVASVRASLVASPKLIRDQGELEGEKSLRERLVKLSELVLHPLLKSVKGVDWRVSPDGSLWLVPWEAMVLPDGKFAIEKLRFTYLTSGRDLVSAPVSTGKLGRPLILADPDFDLDPREAVRETRKLIPELKDDFPTRSLSRSLRLGDVPRLPGTGTEARAITPSLAAATKQQPLVLLNKQAVKAALLAARRPQMLVLSTHGFYLAHKGGGDVGESPLLRCGLLLAGCNQASAGGFRPEDAVLTGLEAGSLDLRGCELVVLSACETGLGDTQAGEGVAGLRQAFQFAGAQMVVSTLWEVPDRPSARLMTYFFRNLAQGLGKSEALRQAQLTIIEERRDDYAAAHPLFWAAFTLTGR